MSVVAAVVEPGYMTIDGWIVTAVSYEVNATPRTIHDVEQAVVTKIWTHEKKRGAGPRSKENYRHLVWNPTDTIQ